MKLYPLRYLHRRIFGANQNYQRLYPVHDRLIEISLDYLSEHNHIRAAYNSKGLRDPAQRGGFSEYQIFAILKMLSELADDKSESAIATFLTGKNPIRIVRSQLEAIADGEKYSKQAVADWVMKQSGQDNKLELSNEITTSNQ